MSTNPTIIGQGAEAVIKLEKRGKGAKEQVVVKDRIPKKYRHPQLDSELRTSRSRRERKILEKAAKLDGVNIPQVLEGDDYTVVMEHIDGPQVKEVLEQNKELAREVGRILGRLHTANIIHGDLTTSNMILHEGHRAYGRASAASEARRDGGWFDASRTRESFARPCPRRGGAPQQQELRSVEQHSGPIFFIDFGLSYTSTRAEDKAVDLHLFRQALESRHHTVWEHCWRIFLKGYRETYSGSENGGCEAVMERLKKVETRGRNKAKF